jgi:hypothetical protein
MTDETTTEDPKMLDQLTREETLALIESDPADYFVQFFEALGYAEDTYNWGRIADEADGEEVNGFALKKVDFEGGYEGGGDHCEVTYAVVEKFAPDVLLAHCQFTGWYSSNEGSNWEDAPKVVYPRQVVVTQYFDTPE